MRNIGLALALALVTACGGVDFSGTYVGPMATKVICNGEVVVDDTTQNQLDIVDNGTEVIVDLGDCGDIRGTPNENSVLLGKRTCPPQKSSDGSQVTISFTGGTLALNGTSLDANLTLSYAIAGPKGSGTCPGTLIGQLSKQAD